MTSDEKLLSADVQARKDALDVTRSFIVQAPAGSGKTELLIQRYLSLLSVVDNPEEIIAITFTRKAAAEMQLRVLDAIRQRISGNEPDAEHEKLTYQLAGRALDRSSAREWNLVGNPRRMRILTLDALNASIARSQPLSAPGSNARIVVGAELQAVNRAAALATLDWLAERGEMRVATIEVLQHVDNNTALYASYLSQMLGTRDQWLPFIGSGLLSQPDSELLREKFEQSLEFAVTEHLQRTADAMLRGPYDGLFELLDYAAVNMRESGATNSAICSLEGLTGAPAASPENLDKWRGIGELLLTQKGEFRKTVNVRLGFPTTDKPKKNAICELLKVLADDHELAASLHSTMSLPPTRYTDEQWKVLLALFRLLPLAVTELKRLFNEQGIADHIDIALSASAALGSAENPGDVALLLDYQVKHLLVDEMQDTSAAQYRMLETLTAGWESGDGRSLYCVGDPMQSIYRFRNAEVGQFLLAQEFGIGSIQLQPLVLRRNFRSGENLVHWFNSVFPTVLAATDDPIRGAVSYSEAVPAEHLSGQGECITHPVFEADKEKEAQLGCRVIAETLQKCPEDNMAVLVRGRTQLPQLLAELRNAGIAYSAVEIDSLTDLPEIIDVLALTRAAAHQGDRIAWLGILRAPWIGLDWSDLHALVRNDSSSTVWELLNDEERRAALSAKGREATDGVLSILSGLTTQRRFQGLRDLVERIWFALGGPAILGDQYAIDNVYRFFEVLGQLESAGTLLDIGELESVLDMERVSSDASSRLQIMTMHRAKGLQFDHVLLYGLGRIPGKGDRRVLSWFDLPAQHGAERKVISPVAPRAEIENDPVHRYIELTQKEKDRYEQARLLYVACTRAKKTLHLMGNTTLANDGESFRSARSDSLLHLLWTAVEPEFISQFATTSSTTPNTDAALFALPQLRRFVTPWRLPQAKLLAGADAEVDLADEENQLNKAVEFYWVGSDARIAGTLVHRWLQLIADNLAHGAAADGVYSNEVTLRWIRESGIEASSADGIVRRVERAVVSTLSDPTGRWILEGPGHAELALSGVADQELVSVVLDRVRIDDDGTHWIIDYKSSTHEGGNLDGFLRAEEERYRPQLQRYAEIYGEWASVNVKCALYFPLLQAFVAVAP